MYKWAVRRMIRADVRRLRETGDVVPTLRRYRDDAVLVFPGTSSWAGEHRGRSAIEGFLRRFVAVGLRGETDEILVNGPPWNTLVCVRFTDQATGPDGEIVYENRAVLFARIVWGRIVFQEDYEDTQKVEAFDRHLAALGERGAAARSTAVADGPPG